MIVVLRVPLAFGRAHIDLTLSEGGAVAPRGWGGNGVPWPGRGKQGGDAVGLNFLSLSHFALFTVVAGTNNALGVVRRGSALVRPGWNVGTWRGAHSHGTTASTIR